jgi:hypothetical protein
VLAVGDEPERVRLGGARCAGALAFDDFSRSDKYCSVQKGKDFRILKIEEIPDTGPCGSKHDENISA